MTNKNATVRAYAAAYSTFYRSNALIEAQLKLLLNNPDAFVREVATNTFPKNKLAGERLYLRRN